MLATSSCDQGRRRSPKGLRDALDRVELRDDDAALDAGEVGTAHADALSDGELRETEFFPAVADLGADGVLHGAHRSTDKRCLQYHRKKVNPSGTLRYDWGVPKKSKSQRAITSRYSQRLVTAEIRQALARKNERGTHKKLADALGLETSQQLSHRLAGDYAFSVEELGAVADFFDAPLGWPFIPWSIAARMKVT